MTAEEVAELLTDTPQGVYQVGALLSGPLGLLTSNERRYIPPTARSLPLWHCSDTGCASIHHVNLQKPQIPVEEAFTRLDTTATRHLGPASEWGIVLRSLIPKNDGLREHEYFDMPALIGDAVVGNDRVALLEAALNSSDSAFLRSVIGASPRSKNLASGSAAQVASRLSEATQLQLLLLLSDRTLVSLIDECVRCETIKVPPNELRKANFSPPTLSAFDSPSQLSFLESGTSMRSR